MIETEPSDCMVQLAALMSRSEALVVASMLEANGIPVFVGAGGHGSVEMNSVALGGYRLWIPGSHHRAASDLLVEVLGEDEWSFCPAARTAVLRFLGLWAVLQAAALGIAIVGIGLPVSSLLAVPLSLLTVPVNPQARGDYYLYEDLRY